MITIKNNSNYNKRQFWSYRKLIERSKKISNNVKKEYLDKDINNNNKNNNKYNKHKTKKQFHIINDKVITDKDLIKRIESIYIPPAYKELVIAKSENNKIQAIGTDIRGRRQYIYNPKYTKKRNERKYDDVMELGKSIIKIEKI